jgi:hypothetical protein
LQDALAGYGYALGRALLPLLAGAFVAEWLVFRARHPVPVGPGPHPAFNAASYTLDVLIPAPALGQASDFDPQGAGLAVAAGLHILGWLLAITVIAAITRSLAGPDSSVEGPASKTWVQRTGVPRPVVLTGRISWLPLNCPSGEPMNEGDREVERHLRLLAGLHPDNGCCP